MGGFLGLTEDKGELKSDVAVTQRLLEQTMELESLPEYLKIYKSTNRPLNLLFDFLQK